MLGQKSTRPLPDQTALNRGAMAGRPLRILAAVFLLGGCSTAAEVTGTATQHDLVQIRADVASLQASARQLKAQAEGLGPQVDGRLRDQAADLERQANALGSRLRSEEHTSELQSQSNLVCRLLLEKKKYNTTTALSPLTSKFRTKGSLILCSTS